MADSSVPITSGSGTSIDTRTEGTNGNHRQVVVLGDPATNAGVAPVDVTAGLKVDLGADNDVTVTGTVDLGATDNAVLDTIDAVLDTIKVDTEAIETAVEAIQSGQLADGHNVTIDNASGASAVNIQDGGNTITVDGTVTANLSATDNAVLDDIAADTEAIKTAVEGTLTVTGGGGGVEYTEGDTDATITGSVAMMEVAGDAVEPIQGTVADGLLVNLGSNNDVTVSGVSTSAKQDTIIGHLDGVEGLLTTIDADTGGILTSVQTLDNVVSGNEAQVDVVAALPTGTNAIGRVGHDITGIGHGVKTVTSAGTDEALASSTACKRLVIQAQTDNTGWIAVGATGVDATVATGSGVLLGPGDAFELEIDNLADVFIDATVNGEGVRYSYFT